MVSFGKGSGRKGMSHLTLRKLYKQCFQWVSTLFHLAIVYSCTVYILLFLFTDSDGPIALVEKKSAA